jgi:hypothetical protein
MSLRKSNTINKFAPTRTSSRKKRQGPLEKRRLVAKSQDILQIDADQVEARESDTIYERDNIKYNKEKSLSELESKATERTNEGIFIFNPKEDQKQHSEEPEVLFEPLFKGEAKEFVKMRYDAYKKCSTKFNAAVQDTMRRLHKKFLLDISSFVFKAYSKQSSVTLLPTGIIFAGIDVSDHLETFQLISRSISKLEGSTCAVATLSSQECTSLRNIIQLTVSQVLKNSKLTEPNMQHLVQWQNEIVTKTNNKPKIVILFEDFEHFDPQVLQDFILVCSEYARSLHIVLLIGLATSIEAVHRQLSWSVSSKLETEKFHVLPTHEVLENLITKLIISDDYCLKMGPKAFNFLCTNFDYCNLSINAFVRNMKFAILDYFYTNPMSFVHYTDSQKISTKFLNGHFERIRRWLFTHGIKPGDKASNTLKYKIEPPLSDKQLLDNAVIKSRFVGWVKRLERHNATFSYALRCWIKLQLIHGIQSSYRKEYLALIEKDNTKRFQLVVGHLNRNTDNISIALKSWEKILKNCAALEEDYKTIDKFIKRLAISKNLDEEVESEDDDFVIESMNISDDEDDDLVQMNDQSLDIEDDLIIFNEELNSDPNENLVREPTSELSVSFSFEEQSDDPEHDVVVLSDNLPLSQANNNMLSDDDDLFEVNYNDADVMEEEEKEEDKISNMLKQTPSKAKTQNKASKRKEALHIVTATKPSKPLVQPKKSPEKPVIVNKRPKSLKGQVIEFISEFLKKYLAPLSEFPMYEVFYYNKKKLDSYLNPDVRANIKLALKKPKSFLSCECCGDMVSHTWEDICIIYQFYQSSGRLVNLYDMYMYFTSVVNEKAGSSTTNEGKAETEANTNSKKKSPKKGKKTSGGTVNMDQKSNDVLVARFTQALNELKFMGFIDATSKKEDHVEKLV